MTLEEVQARLETVLATKHGHELYVAALELIEALIDMHPAIGSPEEELLNNMIKNVIRYENGINLHRGLNDQ